VYGTEQPRPGNFEPRYGSTAGFIEAANKAAGRDLGWFFQAYLYQAGLPELLETRSGDRLELAWKTAAGTPFPMPLEVRIGQAVVTLPMENGKGSVTVPPGATVTLDPHSKILRREAHIEAFQEYKKAQNKAKAGS
jgi:aminopeptidase N